MATDNSSNSNVPNTTPENDATRSRMTGHGSHKPDWKMIEFSEYHPKELEKMFTFGNTAWHTPTDLWN